MCLCSGVAPSAEMAGTPYVQSSLQNVLGAFGAPFIAVAMSLFAFTTLVGNYYYCEGCLRLIFKRRPGKVFMLIFRLVAAAIVLVGACVSMDLAWNTADLCQVLMVIINIPVILILTKPAMNALKDYMDQRKEGKEPEFNAVSINLKQKTEFWN